MKFKNKIRALFTHDFYRYQEQQFENHFEICFSFSAISFSTLKKLAAITGTEDIFVDEMGNNELDITITIPNLPDSAVYKGEF